MKTPGWNQIENKIEREFKFKNFVEAMAFVNRVAEESEKMDHHPDIFIHYNRVKLVLWTHVANGLTEKDFQLAGNINAILK